MTRFAQFLLIFCCFAAVSSSPRRASKRCWAPTSSYFARFDCSHLPVDIGGAKCCCMDLLGYCHRSFDPVCGNDGVTYSNECMFCRAASGNRNTLRINYRGPCTGKGW